MFQTSIDYALICQGVLRYVKVRDVHPRKGNSGEGALSCQLTRAAHVFRSLYRITIEPTESESVESKPQVRIDDDTVSVSMHNCPANCFQAVL